MKREGRLFHRLPALPFALWLALLGCSPRSPTRRAEAVDSGAAGAPTEAADAGPQGPSLPVGTVGSDCAGPGAPRASEAQLLGCEALAPRAAEPLGAWLAVARARRLRVEALEAQAAAARPDAPPGLGPADLLAATAAEAQRCAADARSAWSLPGPGPAAAAVAGAPADGALESLGPGAAEPLYLDALCSGAWARARGFTYLVERRAELRAMLERAARLAPGLDDAGPDRELGRLLSALPASAGGNLTEARARFEASLVRAPGSVRTRVLFARGVAVKLQDRSLFESLLQAALAAPSAAGAEVAWAAEARALLGRADDLFGTGP